LSIAFAGISEAIDNIEYARCTELYSVDLVDQPAANPDGLFSKTVDSKRKTVMSEITKWFSELIGKAEAKELQEAGERITTLETTLADKDKQLESISEKLTTLEAELEAKTTALTDAETKLEGFDEKVEQLASAKALQITQQLGQNPTPQDPAGDDDDPRAALKGLHGLDKVVAAFKLQSGENQ
jgi:septal ring factor EnvC (AmiA/AmiB activator)